MKFRVIQFVKELVFSASFFGAGSSSGLLTSFPLYVELLCFSAK
jgi:hypothetical protein